MLVYDQGLSFFHYYHVAFLACKTELSIYYRCALHNIPSLATPDSGQLLHITFMPIALPARHRLIQPKQELHAFALGLEFLFAVAAVYGAVEFFMGL